MKGFEGFTVPARYPVGAGEVVLGSDGTEMGVMGRGPSRSTEGGPMVRVRGARSDRDRLKGTPGWASLAFTALRPDVYLSPGTRLCAGG